MVLLATCFSFCFHESHLPVTEYFNPWKFRLVLYFSRNSVCLISRDTMKLKFQFREMVF
jgi:hypothetical protein